MPLSLLEKIMKELSDSKPFIDLYVQGESLLHPHIVEAVKIVRRNGMLPRITTNTTPLTRKKSKALIEAGLNKIEFSMSGASKKTYEEIYRGARYERTLGNMLDFLELNGEAGFSVHTRSVFVEEQRTMREKEKYLECFSRLPIDDVYVSPLLNFFGWNEEVDLSEFKKLPRAEWPVCKSPWRQFAINADGEVRACCFDYDSRYLVGNANDNHVMDLWNSPRMQKFRQALIDRRYENIEEPGLPLCSECSQIWPTSDQATTTQEPQDFKKEAEAFLANASFAFQVKYRDKTEKYKKLEYIKKHRDEWIAEMIADVP